MSPDKRRRVRFGDLIEQRRAEAGGGGLAPGGLVCPKCGCRQFKVRNTLPVAEGVRRYRTCRHCGATLTTTEH